MGAIWQQNTLRAREGCAARQIRIELYSLGLGYCSQASDGRRSGERT